RPARFVSTIPNRNSVDGSDDATSAQPERSAMRIELDAEQRAWLEEVRGFLREHVTPALRAELAEHDLELPDGEVAAFRRKVGEKGWFGLTWPKEYGGLGLGPVHQHLLATELEYWGVPGPDLTVTSVAPMIM